MTAMSAEQRERHQVVSRQLLAATTGIEELSDGYAARFEPEPALLMLIAEFITLEHLCCPFFTLGLEAAPDRGPVWLKITGPEGIKPFIRVEFGFGS
jgi:hypothetical protein